MDNSTYNDALIKKDLETLVSLNQYLYSFSKQNKSILFLNFIRYNNFIILEMSNYLKKKYKIDIISDLENKKSIQKIRSKLKCNASVEKTANETNAKMHRYFKNKNNPIIMKLFPKLCDNYGIFLYKNDVIANSFDIHMLMKKILYTDSKIDEVKIINYSKDIGSLINHLCTYFYINKAIPYKTNNSSHKIISKDYNLYKYKNDNSINKTIFMINKLCDLNFYKLFILRFYNNQKNSLDIKLKYILCRNIIEELKSINFNFNYDEYSTIFNNQIFRNFMYHYEFPYNFYEIINKKVLYGICESLLHITEEDLNIFLNNCIDALINSIKNSINNSKYNYLIK